MKIMKRVMLLTILLTAKQSFADCVNPEKFLDMNKVVLQYQASISKSTGVGSPTVLQIKQIMEIYKKNSKDSLPDKTDSIFAFMDKDTKELKIFDLKYENKIYSYFKYWSGEEIVGNFFIKGTTKIIGESQGDTFCFVE